MMTSREQQLRRQLEEAKRDVLLELRANLREAVDRVKRLRDHGDNVETKLLAVCVAGVRIAGADELLVEALELLASDSEQQHVRDAARAALATVKR